MVLKQFYLEFKGKEQKKKRSVNKNFKMANSSMASTHNKR